MLNWPTLLLSPTGGATEKLKPENRCTGSVPVDSAESHVLNLLLVRHSEAKSAFVQKLDCRKGSWCKLVK